MKKYNIDGLPGLTMQGKKGPNGKRGCRTFCNVQNSYKLDLEYQYSVGVYSETGDIIAIPIPSYGIIPILGDYVINVTNSKSYLYSVINIIPIEKSVLKNALREEDSESSDDSDTDSLSFNDEVIALLKTIDGVDEITTGDDPYYYVFELSLLDTWNFKSGVVFDSDLNVLVKSTKLRRTPWYGYYKPMYIKSETTFESFPGNHFSYVDKNGKIFIEDPIDKSKQLTPANGYKCLFNFYRDILGYGVNEYGWLQTTPGEISPIVNLPLKDYDYAPLDVFANVEHYNTELEKGKNPDDNDLSVVNEVSENYAVQCLKLKIIDSLTGKPFKSYLEEVAEGEEQPNLEYDIEVSIVFGDEYYVDFGNAGDSNENNSQQNPVVTYTDDFKDPINPDEKDPDNKETLWSIVDKGSVSQKGYCLNLTNRLVQYTCKRRQPSITPPHEDTLKEIYEKRTFNVDFKVKVNRNSNIKKGDKDRVYKFEVIYFKPTEPNTVISLVTKDESNLDDGAVNPLDNYTDLHVSSIYADTIFQIKYYTKYIEDVDDPEAEYVVVEHIIEKTAEDIIAGMSTYDDTTDRIDIQEVISDEEYLRSISNTILSAGSSLTNDTEETSSDIEISKIITSEIRYVNTLGDNNTHNAPIHVDSTGCASIPLIYYNGSKYNDYSNTIAYITIKPYIAAVSEDRNTNTKPTWTDSLFFPATILFNNKNVTVDDGGIIEVECRVLKRSFIDDERVKKLGAVVGPTTINEKDVYFEQSNYFWSEDTVGDAKLRYEEGTYGYNNQFATHISEDPFNAMFKVESDKLLFYSSANPAVNKSKLQPIDWLKTKLSNNEEDVSLDYEDDSIPEDMYEDFESESEANDIGTDNLITSNDIDSYNENGRTVEYTEYALTQFVISTTLSSADLKNIKIVAELYNNDKEHIKSVSSCMDKMWDTDLYSNDTDSVDNVVTTRKDILRDGLDKFILIQRSTPTSTKFYNYSKTATNNLINPHYFEVASYNDFENCYEYNDEGKVIGMSQKYNKYGMYNHLGHSKNFTSALNFDDENIFPCTILLKDYNTMNDPGDNISTIMIPTELFNKCTMSVYAYCKTSSTSASKILLGTSTGNETY